jgi:hypothetical protein
MLIREQNSLLQEVLAAAGLRAGTTMEIRDGQLLIDGVQYVLKTRVSGAVVEPSQPAKPAKTVAATPATRKAKVR